MNKQDRNKKFYPYLIAIGLFWVIVLVYFSPILKGYELNPHDVTSWKGAAKELLDFKEKTGHTACWTNSMFSGMPAFGVNYPTKTYMIQETISKIYTLGIESMAGILMSYLLGFFVLLKAFRVNTWLSIIGAIAMAFSSYFIIIIEAGHVTKSICIGFMAFSIAGFYLIFRGKYLLGAILSMAFLAMATPLHPQMFYYVFMLLGVFFITEAIIKIKEKAWKQLLISTAVFLGSVGIAIGANAEFFMTNQEYLKHTMRGGHSELTKEDEKAAQKTSGLDLDYATQWSYGVDETMTLLIPNFKGGSSSGSAGKNSETYNALVNNGYNTAEAKRINDRLPMYWGTQPFTSGSVYVGAIIVFLFVLGLFIVKTPYKWALLIATAMSIFLAWGKNMMWLTELFMNYFPYYNKFRAVSSILIVAEITMPLLGFLALHQLFTDKDKKKYLPKIKMSLYITGGICLFFALFGSMFYDFQGADDAQNLGGLADFIQKDRASLLQMDSFRSLVFILLTFGTLWLFIKEKLKPVYFLLIIGGLILVDMWMVDKRYLNESSFIPKRQVEKQFMPSEADRQIMQDPDIHYRVWNLTASQGPFNDSYTSYFHKSIGGYSAVKLSRYQDMIEHHITKQNWQVINMLNTKYFIFPDENKIPRVQRNENALGNAWFVDSLVKTGTPDQEIEALNHIQIAHVAVIDTNLFGKAINGFEFGNDTTSSIILTSYTPDELRYKAKATNKQNLLVFSEVYYPDWFAYVDEQQVEVFRVNYILRAIIIPEGEHEITLVFKPQMLEKGIRISLLFWGFIGLVILGSVGFWAFKQVKNKQA